MLLAACPKGSVPPSFRLGEARLNSSSIHVERQSLPATCSHAYATRQPMGHMPILFLLIEEACLQVCLPWLRQKP